MRGVSAVAQARGTGRGPARQAGFTLVEVLVALFAMALLAALSWQGLDSVLRSRDAGRLAIDDAVRLSTVLTQWEQDLLALHDSTVVPALDFDGQTLRLTRRTEAGVALVTWAVRGGVWQRWMSPPYTHGNELQEAWLRSRQFLGNEAGQLVVARKASEWQLYYFRGEAWTNAQSTGDLQTGAALPNADVASAPTSAASAAEAAAQAASAAEAAASGANTGATAGGAATGSAETETRSTGATARTGAGQRPLVEALPAAVRLVVTLDGKKLTRDIALAPAGS